jgi:hypothetical protein
MILPVILNIDSEDMVDTGIVKTSLAMMDSTGYVSLCSCHHLKMSNESSNWLTVSQSKYETSSEALEAVEVAACSKAVADVSLDRLRVECSSEVPPPDELESSSYISSQADLFLPDMF